METSCPQVARSVGGLDVIIVVGAVVVVVLVVALACMAVAAACGGDGGGGGDCGNCDGCFVVPDCNCGTTKPTGKFVLKQVLPETNFFQSWFSTGKS